MTLTKICVAVRYALQTGQFSKTLGERRNEN